MDRFIDLTDVHHAEEVVLAVPLDAPDPDPRPCPLSGGLADNPTVVDALARAPNLSGLFISGLPLSKLLFSLFQGCSSLEFDCLP